MAARLTDRQKKKVVADYLETQSVNAAAKRNGVSWGTAKSVLDDIGEIEKKLDQKKRENTADVLAYMESQRGLVCEIIGKGLAALNEPDKLAEATPAQITTAVGTLIDKWTAIGGSVGDTTKEDGLSQSLRELAEELESDD
jgi:hypothetical protein